MNIGISTIGFNPGRTGGSETYLRNLLHYLQKVDHSNSYSIFCNSLHAPEFPLSNPAFRLMCIPRFTKPSPGWLCRGVLRRTLGIDIVRWSFRRHGMDVLHHPMSLLNPRGLSTPSVLTFFDIQHEYLPDFFSPAELAQRKAKYQPSAEEATRIIAISRFTKNSLVERYDINSDKIDVIPIGCGENYRVIDDWGRLEKTQAAYGLDRPFLYYPAATWPHKNHKALLAALRLLIDRFGFDGQLVLTGAAFQSQTEIMQEIRRLGLEGTVKLLGYLPYEDLPCLFNLARMLVFPSLFEGFGIPLVEAMACGCPVACSNTTSLPEVAGEAAVMFDPNSAEDMAEKIWSVWESDADRHQLREKGLRRLALFDWEEIARSTVAVYEKAAEGH